MLSRINNEIEKLEKQRSLIENLEIKAVDEKTWHEICLTPARDQRELIRAIAKATFPQGENFKVRANEVVFTLNGFTIELPTCATKGIKIDLRWFKPSYKEPPKEYRRFNNMRKYFDLLDNGNYTWYDLACCRCNSNQIKENKFKLFMWWFCKAKWHKVDRQKWEDMFKHEDEQTQRRLEEHKRKVDEIETKLNKVNDTIDILKQFSEVKGYVNINGTWYMTNVENYFR